MSRATSSSSSSSSERIAEHAHERRVGCHELAVGGGLEHAGRDVLEQFAVALLGRLQREQRMRALGRVAQHAFDHRRRQLLAHAGSRARRAATASDPASSSPSPTSTTIGICVALGWMRRKVVRPALSGRFRSSRIASTRPCLSRARPSASVEATSSRYGWPRIGGQRVGDPGLVAGLGADSRTLTFGIDGVYGGTRARKM